MSSLDITVKSVNERDKEPNLLLDNHHFSMDQLLCYQERVEINDRGVPENPDSSIWTGGFPRRDDRVNDFRREARPHSYF